MNDVFCMSSKDMFLNIKKKEVRWTAEMAERLRMCTAFAEDQSSIPASMSRSSKLHLTPAPGDLMPSSGICGHPHTCSTD